MPVQKSHTAGCHPLAIANCLETADIQNQLFHVNQKRKDIMAKMHKDRLCIKGNVCYVDLFQHMEKKQRA